ncbi:berberine bridge enzyme-like 13 [Salvia hispanica]|uniref:berberine bridge enzyme-like 13 n=1 Tax=Salvia hispanica TaxID=49212 RepID=UPI002009D5A9|nr:berberine bridge enzyme-like 13 [Salvia hispanica]
MSRKHSLAADHIIDALLINADGEVLDRRTMGKDLFWAIRGGGGTSFGIILEFTVTLVTVPETITIFNVTRTLEENATELVDKWQHIADKVDENLLMRLFVNPTNSPTSGNRTVAASFTSLYLGKPSDLLTAMGGQFPELGLTEQDCVEMSWAESLLFFANIDNQTLDVLTDRPAQGGPGSYFKGKSDFVSAPIPVSGLREMWRFLLEGRVGVELELSPFGGALSAYSDEETPFPHRKGNVFMIHYGVGWAFANEAEGRLGWIRGLYAYMARHVTRNPRGAYVNYRDLDLGRNGEGNTTFEQARVWGERYFKSNFRKLVSVKTRVDPSNFFRNEQSIPERVAMYEEKYA